MPVSVWFTAVDPPTPKAATANDSHPGNTKHARAALISAAPRLGRRPFIASSCIAPLADSTDMQGACHPDKRMITGDNCEVLPPRTVGQTRQQQASKKVKYLENRQDTTSPSGDSGHGYRAETVALLRRRM